MILKLRVKDSWVYIDGIKECQVYPLSHEEQMKIELETNTKMEFPLYKVQYEANNLLNTRVLCDTAYLLNDNGGTIERLSSTQIHP